MTYHSLFLTLAPTLQILTKVLETQLNRATPLSFKFSVAVAKRTATSAPGLIFCL